MKRSTLAAPTHPPSYNGASGAGSAADHSEKALDFGTVGHVNGITAPNAKRAQWELDAGKVTSFMFFKGGCNRISSFEKDITSS